MINITLKIVILNLNQGIQTSSKTNDKATKSSQTPETEQNENNDGMVEDEKLKMENITETEMKQEEKDGMQRDYPKPENDSGSLDVNVK